MQNVCIFYHFSAFSLSPDAMLTWGVLMVQACFCGQNNIEKGGEGANYQCTISRGPIKSQLN